MESSPNVAQLLLSKSRETNKSCRGLSHPKLDGLPSRCRLFPVIHLKSIEQALENANLAHSLGCDGVFLINHGNSSQLLINAFKRVQEALPNFFVGLNILTEWTPAGVFQTISKANIMPDGIWIDNAEIDERHPPQAQQVAISIHKQRVALNMMQPLYFGGVDFKYQREVAQDRLSNAAYIATYFMDVVCTSGPRTGIAPDATKIKLMSTGVKRCHGAALAIASGVDEQNVQALMEAGAEAFLVATSICSDFHNLDREKLQRLVEKIHSYPLQTESSTESLQSDTGSEKT